jgi:tRNA guanosine-2'-O-methyltransferase
MFESENKILAKEGVIHFLELYDVKSLPYSPELSEVMASHLLPILTFIRT